MWSLLGTSLSTLLFVHSLLSLSLFCSHLSLFLSLAVILLFDFYPVESGLYLWQCSCRQMLTHSRPRWGIIQKQSSRFAQRLHTQTHRDGCPACLDTESCLTAHESMHTHLHSLTVFLVRYNPPVRQWQRGLQSKLTDLLLLTHCFICTHCRLEETHISECTGQDRTGRASLDTVRLLSTFY